MRTYPAYRASTETWFPDCPTHWVDTPVWTMFTRMTRKGFPNETLLSVYRDHGVVPKSSRDDNFNRASEDLSTYQLVNRGDLVVNKMKAWQGSLSISNYRGIVSPAYFVYEPHHHADERYLHHLLRSQPLVAAYIGMSKGVRINQWDLEPQQFSQLKLPLPPLAEQLAIADYLDRETVRIDTLITEQQRLIEILRERRRVQIEQACARGVDGAESLVPSGLFWNDSVPGHWIVANIRKFAAMRTGHTPSRSKPEYWTNCSIPWFTLADVWQLRGGDRTYLGETTNQISELGLANSAADLLPAGTVVLSRTASVGFTGIMPVPMATSQDFWNWIPGEQLDAEYLMWVFRAMRREFDALMIGSTHKTIYQPTAAAFRIPIPPLDEQRRIAAHLNAETAKTDTLIAETEHLVALARERRSALITAAVTGQIDVREAA